MIYIDDVYGIEVLDSRGNPTVKTTVILSDGIKASAIVPSGASTGSKEAIELRDKDAKRFKGKGVLKACENVGKIGDELIGVEPFNQAQIDKLIQEIDGTNNYSNLGANAALGVSMAVARAAAKSLDIPLYRYIGGANAGILPVPMFNVINGGKHADNSVDFQEYMLMPLNFNSFSDALRAVTECYHSLKEILQKSGHSVSLGDEGGFAPNLKNNEEPVKILVEAINHAGYKAGKDMFIALDTASSEFYGKNGYDLKGEKRVLSSAQMVDYYAELCEKYPIVSIEDGLSEDDWEGWELLTKKLGSKIQLVGDDLFVTNAAILAEGIKKRAANSILIKLNQIGTLTQTLETIRLAHRSGYTCVVSHRSGESEDAFIADLAVAINSGQIKTGATARGERTAKYNRLLEIERELNGGEYLGKAVFGR
ncbi:MAG: phosphopyruvate hydratase [Campylobacteraceae bacterium]|jgi:enolase|nr:phosphopyruvate hydratase [Campylobacteraceae bacterium]